MSKRKSCRLSFYFPTLAGQQHSAWDRMLTARIVGHLAPRQPERIGGVGVAQSVAPSPAQKFYRVMMTRMFECHFPKPIRTHIHLCVPHHTVATLPFFYSGEDFCIQ